MFGHLKNEEFMEIVEAASASATQKAHLDSCMECASTLKSTAAIHTEFVAIDADILEPNWEEFRSAVRNGLLSRSIQRQSVVRRWTGWPLRSSFALAMSLLVVAGLAAGGVVWHLQYDLANRIQAQQAVVAPAVLPAVYIDSNDPAVADSEITAWSHNDAFEDLSQVDDAEEPQLRQLIQSAISSPPSPLERQ